MIPKLRPAAGLRISFVLWCLTLAFGVQAAWAEETGVFRLQTRARVPLSQLEDADFVNRDSVPFMGFLDRDYIMKYQTVEWKASETAFIVCDVWNYHGCMGAVRRVNQMVPRMNEMLKAARNEGALIIFSPSGVMDKYGDHPARKRTIRVKEEMMAKGERLNFSTAWNNCGPNEPPLPIDASDGGCRGKCRYEAHRFGHWPVSAQHPGLEIMEEDGLSENDEIYYLLRQRGIKNVVILGVHVNMCVLGRPFGIRNMVAAGYNIVLMRDMTDSMYNSESAPYVSHIRGTELVVAHIERHWCPTIVSSDILGGRAFRFEEDQRPHVAFIVNDDSLHADKTIPLFADDLMAKQDVYCTIIHGEGRGAYRHLDELDDSDAVVIFQKDQPIPPEMREKLEQLYREGRGVVALRNACRAFGARSEQSQNDALFGDDFAARVLGAEFVLPDREQSVAGGCFVSNAPEVAGQRILRGVEGNSWRTEGGIYQTRLAEGAVVLMRAKTRKGGEFPAAWLCKTDVASPRVAYSSLGYPSDFDREQFRNLIRNLIFWSMNLPCNDQ
ncbi:MAG: ThuA domain-containing protein [Planctomycetia bacterium]|nr:ThuA domain-containing protein [Planctomycetia bacterium]